MKYRLIFAITLMLVPSYAGEQKIPTLIITSGNKTNTFHQEPHFVPYALHIQNEKNTPFFAWVPKEVRAAVRFPLTLHSKDGTNTARGVSLDGLNAVIGGKEFQLYVWSGIQNYGRRTQGNKWVDDNYLSERYFIWFHSESEEVITSQHMDDVLRKELPQQFSILRYLSIDRYIGELISRHRGKPNGN